MKEENTYKRRQGMSIVFSVVLHLVLLVLVIAASAMPVKEKPKVLKVQLASLKKPEPPPIREVKTPDPPKPEVKPDPPKPDPPKPDPPKPEVKPDPPKQVAKPDPPKPAESKPVPKPEVKPLPTPKPVVKNLSKPPEPKPVAKIEQPKSLSMRERLEAGLQKQTPPSTKTVPKQRTSSASIMDKLDKMNQNQPRPTSAPSGSVSAEMAAIEVETRSYAEEVVRPYIQRNWREPSKGELDVRNPSAVEVSFTVYASGNVANARIVKMSNSRVLNSSVQEFLRNMTRLSPLSAIGSNSSSLTIIVTMSITN